MQSSTTPDPGYHMGKLQKRINSLYQVFTLNDDTTTIINVHKIVYVLEVEVVLNQEFHCQIAFYVQKGMYRK